VIAACEARGESSATVRKLERRCRAGCCRRSRLEQVEAGGALLRMRAAESGKPVVSRLSRAALF